MIKKQIPLIVVVGPTASGKTKLSIELAKLCNGEIVSADSMQVYKYMNIANASPTEEEKQDIPHHLLNFLDPSVSYSVADYVEYAKRIIGDINERGKIPILVGGTGLYIDSLVNNIDFVDINADEELRNALYDLYDIKGLSYMLDLLKSFDPDSYERLKEQRNIKRIIRSIEVYISTGVTQTEHNINSKLTPSPYYPVKIGLKCDNRDFLYDRINKRVDLMIENGLLDEAKNFIAIDKSNTSSMAIGHKELLPYFNGDASLDSCIENLKMQTRRYAKRQLTWFLKDKTIKWFDIDRIEFDEIVDNSMNYIKEELNG